MLKKSRNQTLTLNSLLMELHNNLKNVFNGEEL